LLTIDSAGSSMGIQHDGLYFLLEIKIRWNKRSKWRTAK